MEDKIEVGEYVRTREGYIGILIDINMKNWNYLTVDCKRRVRRDFSYPDSYLYLKNEDIFKHSQNIIDLIEEGDYVNGHEVLIVYGYDEDGNDKDGLGICEVDGDDAYYLYLEDKDIKSIVTKEQFNSIKYEIE